MHVMMHYTKQLFRSYIHGDTLVKTLRCSNRRAGYACSRTALVASAVAALRIECVRTNVSCPSIRPTVTRPSVLTVVEAPQ